MALAALVAACAPGLDALTAPPALRPVGAGLATGSLGATAGARPGWQGGPADLFRDRRARRPGDVLTVEVAIDDRASLNSNLNRSRKATISGALGFAVDWLGIGGDGSADVDSDTSSSTAGQGSIARAERIRVAVAAVVTGVLPNGHLIIAGSQEVRVNAELRELTVAGIVDPGDVSGDNTVAYDKIAEARISYGGRGRVSDVQQPSWGHQAIDVLAPF